MPQDLEQRVELNYFSEFMKMIGSLALVLILVAITIWSIRKLTYSKGRYTHHGRFIHVLEKKQLHPKASIYLIEVLGKGLVVGESSGCLETLGEFGETTDLNAKIADLENLKSEPHNKTSWKKWISRTKG